MRRFNTTGPCDPRFHYMLDPEPRLPEARKLAERGDYFVVHAPRQTGKTTLLRALARTLTGEGRYAALHFSSETGEPAGDDYEAAQRAILGRIRRRAEIDLPSELWPPPWPGAESLELLGAGLREWARACPRPLVLLWDEIDALRGQSLRTVLRQLRANFSDRPEAFPWAVALCGMRDVRDYKAAGGGDAQRLGSSSPFNIKVKSLRLGDFDASEVRSLLGQHAAEAEGGFDDEAMARAFELTAGQPWLVNALGREVTEEMDIEASETISVAHVEVAKERLIRARQTHLDSLVARLHEPRVRRIVEPIIASDLTLPLDARYSEDLSYVRDLGLLAPDDPVRTANPIYREVMIRALAYPVESGVMADPRSFVADDGSLALRRVLEEFAAFWREHGEVLTQGLPYHEVAPQLVLLAYLQRVVNSGGTIDREYGVGRGRIDVLVRWPRSAAAGPLEVQREALELKVWRAGRPDPLGQGLAQLDGYLERLGLDNGWLIIFDRRPEAAGIAERTAFERATAPSGRAIEVLRA